MTATPAPVEYRIEWTGNIKVYVPIRPVKP